MKYVEGFTTHSDVTQSLLFRVTFDEVIKIEKAPEKLRGVWTKYGIPYQGKKIKPEDGEVFLKAVANDFNGSMVRSDDVKGK